MSKSKPTLNQVATWYSSFQGLNGYMIKAVFEQFKPYLKEPLLEVGPADGYMTHLISTHTPIKSHTLIEASSEYATVLQNKFPHHTIINELLESVPSQKKFNTIIASHVLEHVPNPQQFLTSLKQHLNPTGNVLLSVPNALSVHRLIGVEIGLIPTPTSLNEADKKIGHYRVYTPQLFTKHIRSAGFKIKHASTSFIKFLSNSQYETLFDEQFYNAGLKLTRHFPQHGADIIVVATL